MKFYDKGNKRIIIFEKLATYEFWDKQWQRDNFVGKAKASQKFECGGRTISSQASKTSCCLRIRLN